MKEHGDFDWSHYLGSMGVALAEISGVQDDRNEVVRARTDGGRELLAKRGKSRGEAGDGALLQEGLAYLLLKELGISGIAPKCILHDRQKDVLITELIEGRTLDDAFREVNDAQQWAQLGATVAELHSRTRIYPEWAGRLLGDFTDLVPQALPLDADDLIDATIGQLQIVRALQSDPLIQGRLQDLADVRNPTVIHADLRTNNILLTDNGGFRLVDLELTRVGDPLYDLGTLLASLLEFHAIHGQADVDALGVEAQASRHIEKAVVAIHEPARVLVASYRASMRAADAPLDAPEEFLSRLAGMVGVALLHRAGAIAHVLHGETREARLLLVMGCTFLRNPSALLRPLGLDASYNWLQRERAAS